MELQIVFFRYISVASLVVVEQFFFYLPFAFLKRALRQVERRKCCGFACSLVGLIFVYAVICWVFLFVFILVFADYVFEYELVLLASC